MNKCCVCLASVWVIVMGLVTGFTNVGLNWFAQWSRIKEEYWTDAIREAFNESWNIKEGTVFGVITIVLYLILGIVLCFATRRDEIKCWKGTGLANLVVLLYTAAAFGYWTWWAVAGPGTTIVGDVRINMRQIPFQAAAVTVSVLYGILTFTLAVVGCCLLAMAK